MTTYVPQPLQPHEVVPGFWVEEALAYTGKTQADLARSLEMTAVAVNRWVRGKAPLSRARWAAIKGVLGLPPDWEPKGE